MKKWIAQEHRSSGPWGAAGEQEPAGWYGLPDISAPTREEAEARAAEIGAESGRRTVVRGELLVRAHGETVDAAVGVGLAALRGHLRSC